MASVIDSVVSEKPAATPRPAPAWNGYAFAMLLPVGSLLLLYLVFFRLETPSWMTPRAWSLFGWSLPLLSLLGLLIAALAAIAGLIRKRASLLLTGGRLAGIAVLGILLWRSLDTFVIRQNTAGQAHFLTVIDQNEAAIIAWLPRLTEAMQNGRFANTPHTNTGDSGTYAGLRDLRGGGALPADLQATSDANTGKIHGYVVTVYVPMGEAAKRRWCAYAWPEAFGMTGERSFFIDETGAIYTRTDERFSGADSNDGPPDFDAWFPGFAPGQPKDYSLMQSFGKAIATERWRRLDGR